MDMLKLVQMNFLVINYSANEKDCHIKVSYL